MIPVYLRNHAAKICKKIRPKFDLADYANGLDVARVTAAILAHAQAKLGTAVFFLGGNRLITPLDLADQFTGV